MSWENELDLALRVATAASDLVRAIYKMRFKPRVIGSLIAVAGFLVARFTAQPISLPSDVVAYLRAEQRRKLRALASGLFRSNWRFGV